MKSRIALFSILGLLVFGLLMGTFFDLGVSQALVSNSDDLFLHIISGYGLVIPYSVFALLGGLLIRITIENKEQKPWLKTLLIILGIIAFAAGIYYAAHDNFTVNGLNKKGLIYDLISYATGAVVCSVTFVLGYLGGKGNENKKLWIAIVIITLTIIVSQLLGTIVLKSLFHRPRYRSLGNGLEFQPWYLPFGDYKPYLTDLITKEEFKSFPSGHSSVSALMVLYALVIPLMFPKKLGKKYIMPFFIIGLIYFIFIALVRVLAGAHFLSDVSFGGILTIGFSIIALTIIDKYKLLEN